MLQERDNFVYERLEDLHIRNVYVFAKAADSKLYVDADYEVQLKEEELVELFKKGALIIVEQGEEANTYNQAVKVVGNKAYTVAVVSTAVSLVEWAAEAAA